MTLFNMASEIVLLQNLLESEIRSVEEDSRSMRVGMSSHGARRIQDLVAEHCIEAVEALANLARLFGKKANDSHLNRYINMWIRLYLKGFMMVSLPVGCTEARDRVKELDGLVMKTTRAYSDAARWLNMGSSQKFLVKDIVELGNGIVEASILDAALEVMKRVRPINLVAIDVKIHSAVRHGYARTVAEGPHSDTERIRALRVMSSTFRIPSTFSFKGFGRPEIEAVEEQATIVGRLLDPVQVLHAVEGQGTKVRWYNAATVFVNALDQLAITVIAEGRGEEAWFRIGAPVKYLDQALLCFNQGQCSSYGRFDMSQDCWRVCHEDQVFCSEMAKRIQQCAHRALMEEGEKL